MTNYGTAARAQSRIEGSSTRENVSVTKNAILRTYEYCVSFIRRQNTICVNHIPLRLFTWCAIFEASYLSTEPDGRFKSSVRLCGVTQCSI